MRIYHEISFFRHPVVASKLRELGFTIQEWGYNVRLFEDDPRWPAVRELRDTYPCNSAYGAIFSNKELRASRWLWFQPAWYCAYPQPQETFDYRLRLFNLADYCSVCGTGSVQQADYCLKREIIWKRYQTAQLQWEYDDVFVSPEAWQPILHKYAIPTRPVLRVTTGKPLVSIRQLVIDVQPEVTIESESAIYRQCDYCGRKKYRPAMLLHGPVPRLTALPTDTHIAKMNIWCGEGACAWHPKIISQDLYRDLLTEKIRGIYVRPISEE